MSQPLTSHWTAVKMHPKISQGSIDLGFLLELPPPHHLYALRHFVMLIGPLVLMTEGPHMVHVYILVQTLFLEGSKRKPWWLTRV